jgi:hypothetical protein
MPLDGSGQKIFGFSEFLAGLALMVLAWTIADVRYRFRIQTAPIPLVGVTFAVVSTVGFLALLTDLWRAEGWLVPKGNLLTPATWQAVLGGAFLLTFFTWAWFAFIRPPRYGRHNAERFARTLYRFILKGSPTELAVIADELAHSAAALVHCATDRGRFKGHDAKDDEAQKRVPPKIVGYANDLLLLIADVRLCRAIVGASPGTALAFFRAIVETKKHGIQIETFAKNVVNEAIANKDSFLYHEAEGYLTGFIGYHKPLSQAMFSNYDMVETVGTLLDPDIYAKNDWHAQEWEVYCRVVLITFRSYVEAGQPGHSFVLYRAKGYIEQAASDLYTLNELRSTWDADASHRLRVVVQFIKDAVGILEEKRVGHHVHLRIREKQGRETFYDYMAEMIFEVIFHASAVKSPQWGCWSIQHNSVWGEFFNFHRLAGPAGRVVKFKVRRLLYDEVSDMNRFPNFKGAKILGFCLNVMGFTINQTDYDRDSKALQKAVLAWTKKHYLWLHAYNPRIAEACLVDGITYDSDRRRLVRTYLAEGLRREPSYAYFELDPPPPQSELVANRTEPC